MTLLTRALLALNPRQRIRAAFTQHYRSGDWMEPETVSGRGSTLDRTAAIRRELPALLRELGVRSILDAGCGDFHWFQAMETALDSYVGVEVVEELAAINQERHGDDRRRFVSLDVTRDDLPRVDLVLCRDCLVHLKNGQVRAALQNFQRSGTTYLLATTFTGDHPNEEAPLGGWRPLNLERAPFRLGPPLRLISERESVEDARYLDKSLGLWALRKPR
ncbi:MAG TPA: class I SAM-dependent methyltransferase [Thermoanaerobaculia bacterium]|nr:class I SAM-dependent methyltransferase [Thermoanaerobaculia bacterium]